MNTARSTGLLAHGGRSFVDWLTGTGFLTLNATCFFVALVVLIPWNVYSSPGDFWVADFLVRWAFLLGFHALLVAVWSLVQNVILKDDRPEAQMTPTARTWHAARAQSAASQINFHATPRSDPAVAGTASALMAEEWARQWLDEAEQARRSAGSSQDSPSPSATATRPEDGPLADWDTSWPEIVNGEPVEADTAQPWPSPPDPQPEVPPAGDPNVAPDELYVANDQAPRGSGPLAAAARAGGAGSPATDAIDPELEWRWIEAAASAWLTRKEREALSESTPTTWRDPGSGSSASV